MLMQASLGGASTGGFSVATDVFNIRYATASVTYSESNMRGVWASNVVAIAIVPKQYGKWAFEVEVVTIASAGTTRVGIREALALPATSTGLGSGVADCCYNSDGTKQDNGGQTAYGATYTSGDKITVLWDADAGTVSFAKNGVNQGVAFSGIPGAYFPAMFVSAGAASQDLRISTTLTYTFPGFAQWR